MRSILAKLLIVLLCLMVVPKANGQATETGGQLPVWAASPQIVSTFPTDPFSGPHFTFNGPQWLTFRKQIIRSTHQMYQYEGPMHVGPDAPTVMIMADVPNGKNPRLKGDFMIESFRDGLNLVVTDTKFSAVQHGVVNGLPAARVYGNGKVAGLEVHAFIYVIGDEFAYSVFMATDSGPNWQSGLQTLESSALTVTLHDVPPHPVRFGPAPQFTPDLDTASESGGVTLCPPKGYSPADLSRRADKATFAGWAPTPSMTPLTDQQPVDANGNPQPGGFDQNGNPTTAPQPTAPSAMGKIWFYGYPHKLQPYEMVDLPALAAENSKSAPHDVANYVVSPVEMGIAGFGYTGRYRTSMDITDPVNGKVVKMSEAIYLFYYDDKIIEARAVMIGDDPKLLGDLETAILTAKLDDKIEMPTTPVIRPTSAAPSPPVQNQPPTPAEGQPDNSGQQGQQNQPTQQGQPAPDAPAPGWAQSR